MKLNVRQVQLEFKPNSSAVIHKRIKQRKKERFSIERCGKEYNTTAVKDLRLTITSLKPVNLPIRENNDQENKRKSIRPAKTFHSHNASMNKDAKEEKFSKKFVVNSIFEDTPLKVVTKNRKLSANAEVFLNVKKKKSLHLRAASFYDKMRGMFNRTQSPV